MSRSDDGYAIDRFYKKMMDNLQLVFYNKSGGYKTHAGDVLTPIGGI